MVSKSRLAELELGAGEGTQGSRKMVRRVWGTYGWGTGQLLVCQPRHLADAVKDLQGLCGFETRGPCGAVCDLE